jgi:hypothetical protein
MTPTDITTIVERPDVLGALANLVQEQAGLLADVETKLKAGLYTDKESYCCDLEDANDGHIIACVAYHAALQLIKGKRINKEQEDTIECALCITGVL